MKSSHLTRQQILWATTSFCSRNFAGALQRQFDGNLVVITKLPEVKKARNPIELLGTSADFTTASLDSCQLGLHPKYVKHLRVTATWFPCSSFAASVPLRVLLSFIDPLAQLHTLPLYKSLFEFATFRMSI
ncbi:hypothetical protein QQP08_016530 [Theobroma cacao]|nr:hypothetical protein QQP08_016530 [Theobroma cacao]